MAQAVRSALGALLLIYSFATSNAFVIEKRQSGLLITTNLPGTWSSQGCYVDVGRTLTQAGYTDNIALTQESCVAYCWNLGYIYAGVEYSAECYCGNFLASGAGPAPASTDCNMACAGNNTEQCGGPNRLNLFWSGTAAPSYNPGPPNWAFSGCYAEGTNGRALPNGVTTPGGAALMTVALCTSSCQTAGYLLAGVEYSGECWCGNTIQNGGVLAPDGLTGCNMLCNGNKTEFCGGSNRLDVYDFEYEVPLSAWTTVSSSTKSSSSSTVSTSSSGISSSSSSVMTTSSSQTSKSSVISSTSTTSSLSSTSSTSKSSSSSSSPTFSSTSSSKSSSFSSTILSSTKTSGSSSISKSVSTSSSHSTNSQTSSPSSSKTSSLSSIRATSSSPTANTVSSKSSTSSSTSLSISTSSILSSTSSSSSVLSSVSPTLSSTSSTSTSYIISSSSSLVSSSWSIIASVSSSVSPSVSSTVSSTYSSTSSSSVLSSVSSTTSVSSSLSSSLSSSPSSSSLSSTLSSSSSTLSSLSSSVSSSISSVFSSSSSSSALKIVSSSSSSLSSSSSSSTASRIVTSPSSSLSSSSSRSSASTIVPYSSSSVLSSSSSKYYSSSSSITLSSSTSVLSSSSATPSSSIFTSSSSSSASSGGYLTSSSQTTSATSTSTSSSVYVSPTLGIKPTIGTYSYIGCYTEATNARALSAKASYDYVAMTLEECYADCIGYTYFGVEYGGECYCGNVINTGSVLATPTDCSFICPGSQYEYCGAGNRLDMYQYSPSIPTVSSAAVSVSSTSTQTGSTSVGSISTASTSTSSSSTSSTSPLATGFPAGWNYQGCYVDGTNGRILNHQLPDNTQNTLEICVQACATAGYTIAGIEYGVECFCDTAIYNGGALSANQNDCNFACPGNSLEDCGAGNRMSLFSIGTPQAYQPPIAQQSGLPANWVYMGCLQDNIPSNEDPNEIVSTFPYMVWNSATANTPTACIEQCQLFGYNAAGLEYGSECFCGDVANIQVASAPGVSTDPAQPQFYTRSRVPQIVPDSQCNSLCTGDPTHLCGSGNLLTYYAWNGTTPLCEWSTPTGYAAGEYSLLIGGVVVPLMTAQNINGKVSFVEKSGGTGEPNGTGAYELDLTEINNFGAAWRTMTGLQTDVFCSAGLILPDLGGRQLTIGGWAGTSNFGVRLYLPDGSAGVQGTNEWVEDPGVLQLQVPRWYPSAMIMANGSILVVGGEIGSNDAEQPTLEILPATGVPEAGTISGYSNTTVYLDFLQETAPFNLYPFVAVVPSGIFIAYYNQARILDENTFETIKMLPQMPGAVNDPTGGRNYQLEGSMVLLPQYAPYDTDLTVLICGGSTQDGGYAIDNCVSTQPEAANPVWTIERMPSRRVMPCMAGLPDGTYLIVNGGQHGVAGFGLGGDPNYNAVLYDPTKEVNQRMSIMANTTVARLYHSEAIVLLDGRVMISGSDPTGDYSGVTGEFPEEYRVEVFTPPYLLSGLPRPTFNIADTDWAYTGTYTFTVTSGTSSGLVVSLLGSVVSTHGNSMGQRTLFPNVVCAGNTCAVTAPPGPHVAPPGWYMMFILNGPTPSVGQFVRIGGDPAGLGNWPDLPGFQLPGVNNPTV